MALVDYSPPVTRGESQTGGEFPNGGESDDADEAAVIAHVDAARRQVLVLWLRDVGYEGYADDLAGADSNVAEQYAYETAKHVEAEYGGDDMAQLVWHLRDWADKHEKLGGK
jgi:hypothetical protein